MKLVCDCAVCLLNRAQYCREELYRRGIAPRYIFCTAEMDAEKDKIPVLDTVHGYDKTQTVNARWLQIDKPLFKMYRQNFYDIGGTYIDDVKDFWFTFNTETVGNILLLHVFITNYQEKHFLVCTSACHQPFSIDKKKQTIHLTQALEPQTFFSVKNGTLSHVTTFSFNELDVHAFDSKTLFIAIKIHHPNQVNLDNAIEAIKIVHDCHALLDQPETMDFIIESETGDELPVHKHILMTHSKVFEAMFREETQDLLKQQDRLVETCCTENLRYFLEFMYTGTIVNLDNCNARTMLELADKYGVQGLRELAESLLLLDINIETCFQLLNDADMFNSDKLKFAALKFIKQNASKLEFKNSSSQLFNKNLIYEITEYIAVKDSI